MKKFGTYRCAAAAALALVLVTGCSSMKFLATGKEFRKICEDNGLQVQDGGRGLEGDVREEGRSHEEMEVGRHQVEEGVEERGDVVARTDVDARLRREFPSILTLSDR